MVGGGGLKRGYEGLKRIGGNRGSNRGEESGGGGGGVRGGVTGTKGRLDRYISPANSLMVRYRSDPVDDPLQL